MARTTIDGLRVRDSEPTNRPASAVRPSAHVVDMVQPAKKPETSTKERKDVLNSINTIKKKSKAQSSNSFLDPVHSFDFDNTENTVNDKFSSGVEMNWSELLKGEQDSDDFISDADNDFLKGWGDEEDEEDKVPSLTKSLVDDEQDGQEELEEKPLKKKKHTKKKLHVGRIVAISIFGLVIVAGGVLYKWGDELISRLTGGNSGLFDAIHSMISDAVPFDTDNNGRTNILVFGTEGYNMNGDTAYGAHDGAQLTDSIMVISLDQNTKDVALLSLPRDLRVSRACSAGKINEVFWCHNQDGTNENAGARALMEQVGLVLGIDFQYYAHINWASLIDIIDTIGGITVTLDENIADYDFTGAVAQAGVPITVNGEQALGLARARHGTVGGDFTRGNTQQKIVEAMVAKIMENGIGITEAFNLVNILGDNLRSNFSTDNIKAGVRVLSEFNITNIRQVPLVDYENGTSYMTTTTINDISYVVPAAGEKDYSQIQAYIDEMFNSNPRAREHARIMIYNASLQYGVAGAERERLRTEDYDVVGVGDAEVGTCIDKYCVYALNDNFPATQAELAEKYSTVVRVAEELLADIEPGDVDIVIVLGLGGDEA